ncbi:MAG TPA: M3 family metallopeptidase, partial [Rhodanobacteraceae bacterium]
MLRIRPGIFSVACCALLAGTVGVTAQASPAGAAAPATSNITANPFYGASKLPFEAPDFSKIKNSDFQPAIEEGMKLQRAEVEKIANNPAPPTFENTIVAMEKTGAMLNRVMAAFELLAGADTNPTLQKAQEVEAPRLAAHRDAIFLNPKLFARIQKLHDRRDSLELDPESARLLEYDYQQFVHNGAKLSAADKAKLKHYNEQLSTLSAQFQNKLLAADKAGALVVNDRAELKGLSPGEIDAAAQAAKARGLKGKWVIPLQNTTQQPALGSLDNRGVRHELFEHSWTRAEKGDANDTRATIEQMAHLRAQKAKLLGFDTFAAWKLEDQMAKTPSAVMNFLDQLAPPAVARAEAEGKDRQAMIDKDQNKAGKPDFKLAAWDWDYYGERVRKAKYDFDESQVKPYFELNNVLENGVFYAANQLYGLTFKERKDIPV